MRRRKMFDLGSGTVGSVNIKTSQGGGLTNEQIADLAVDKIAGISDQAPPHVYHYILLARREERASIIQVLRSSGQKETAEYIRRL